ncbi:replication factor A protein 3 [Rickenella mellea]|uniref:Replication factor A protein 3 n=1 Tax=Rickenella mellea TaxID=50990 RepID=A0A4Y7PUQ9_9AGAM|nr:replication factor A protein 3 [Rickenella mellea]
MSDQRSPRVNSARLPNYLGQTVRLTCKILKLQGDRTIVQASDGGEVAVIQLSGKSALDPYVEIVGRVEDAQTIKAMTSINMGDNLDMKLVNDCVELTHDPRFASMF